MEAVDIRPVRETDAPFWFSLDQHLPQNAWEKLVRDQRGFALLAEGIPAGVLRYHLFWEEIPFCDLLYIAPACQGTGYGRKLLGHWERVMKNLGHSMVLTSTRSDESAWVFYEKQGYRRCGSLLLTLPGYAQPEEWFLEKGI